MFEIETEPDRKLVRLTLTSMFTPAQVVDLYRQVHIAIRAMDCPLGGHLCIVDLTACPLQANDAALSFQSEVDAPGRARRVAMYTGRALARMQARRILRERDDVAVFELREEAEAWLFADDVPNAG